MGGERHPKFAEDRGKGGWGSQARTFPSDFWKVAYLGNRLRPSQSPRPESRQWASAEVELTRVFFLLDIKGLDESMLTTAPGMWMRGALQRAESSAGHGEGSPNPLGSAQPSSNYL